MSNIFGERPVFGSAESGSAKEKKRWNFEGRVEVREDGSYFYTFKPALSVYDVEHMPEEIEDYIVKVIRPKGGGMQKMMALSHVYRSDEPDEGPRVVAAGLLVPRTVYRDEVKALFRLMRNEGCNIRLTIEEYPERPKKATGRIPSGQTLDDFIKATRARLKKEGFYGQMLEDIIKARLKKEGYFEDV